MTIPRCPLGTEFALLIGRAAVAVACSHIGARRHTLHLREWLNGGAAVAGGVAGRGAEEGGRAEPEV